MDISSEKTAQGKSGIGGDVLDDVHGEGGFAHAGPGGDDDHFAVLQAVEHVVELEEAGFDAALAAVFDHFEDFVQHIFHRDELAADFFLGDFEDVSSRPCRGRCRPVSCGA